MACLWCHGLASPTEAYLEHIRAQSLLRSISEVVPSKQSPITVVRGS